MNALKLTVSKLKLTMFAACALAAAAAVAPAVLPAGADDRYAPEAGPHAVEVVDGLTLHDAARDKDLILRISYPAEAGSYPIILWSHAYQSSRLEYTNLVPHWVSHGYVVIQVDHSDSIVHEEPAGMEDWDTRPADMSFVLDSLDDIEAAVPALAGKMDATKVAAAGHLIGAGTADLLTGAVSAEGESFADARISAGLLVCPQGTGQHMAADSWEGCALPRMVLLGSEAHSVRTGNRWFWRADPTASRPRVRRTSRSCSAPPPSWAESATRRSSTPTTWPRPGRRPPRSSTPISRASRPRGTTWPARPRRAPRSTRRAA